MPKNPWHLGQTSERFETGDRGPGSISHTPGDPGGPSYGLSQFALNTGSLQEYLDHSRYAAVFTGVELGSPAFDVKWREVARTDPSGFAQDQHDFTKARFYDAQSDRLKADGLDMSQRGQAVQDALWSTSVQFRSLTPGIFEKGLQEKFGSSYDLSRLTDRDIVGAVQDYKITHNNHLFSHSSAAVKASVLERAQEEKVALLNLADEKTVDHTNQNEHSYATHILEQGAHGPAVRDLQTQLAGLGYLNTKGINGHFGIHTRHAVELFQHDHHLTVDGKVGPLTEHAMQAALRERTVAPSLTDARHPDHALFAQALAGVHALDAQHDRTSDAHSLNLAAALTVEAKREGLTRIDQVAPGKDANRIHAMQNADSLWTLPKWASVDTMTALHTPIAQSSTLAAAISPPPVEAPALQPVQPVSVHTHAMSR